MGKPLDALPYLDGNAPSALAGLDKNLQVLLKMFPSFMPL